MSTPDKLSPCRQRLLQVASLQPGSPSPAIWWTCPWSTRSPSNTQQGEYMKINHAVMSLICLVTLSGALGLAQSNKPSYGTFFGGNLKDDLNDMTIDAQGNIYLVGTTQSNSLQTSHGTKAKGGDDVLVVKFDPTATRVIYAVIYGGA